MIAIEDAFGLPERLPAPGSKSVLSLPKGATDALALASLAAASRKASRHLIVVCADAADVLRLNEEIAWIDPSLSISIFSDWETLPYDTMSPHEALVSERLETLYRLAHADTSVDIVLVAAQTASQHLAPKSFVLSKTFFFDVGQKIHIEGIEKNLTLCGYGHVEQVIAPGEFAVRGSIVDIFPMGSDSPFRLDLFDDEIEAIREFDPDTQRSTGTVERIRILPGHEYPMDEDSLNAFRVRWKSRFTGDPMRSCVYANTLKGIATGGIESYLPLFFEETISIFDYVDSKTLLVTLGDIEASISRFFQDTQSRYEFLRHDIERPALSPSEFLFSAPDFFTRASALARIAIKPAEAEALDIAFERKSQHPLAKFDRFLSERKLAGERVLLATASAGRLNRVEQLCIEAGIAHACVSDLATFVTSDEAFGLTTAPLDNGFLLTNSKVRVITENDLFSTHTAMHLRRRAQRKSNLDAMIRDIGELKMGDPVVHVDHGIGRYAGLETITTPQGTSEFVCIHYAKDAKLFVPVAQLQSLGRYTGTDAEKAPINTLGRGDWEKSKRKAAQKARDTAAELLALYALRESKPGFAYEPHSGDYEAFCEGFGFEETADQAKAIADVVSDMGKGRPMDRLVCGDVGFGKTEVALRAAFVAAVNGKQVAVLCPTTLLAQQHTRTFTDRFANWPIQVAELSRFTTGKDTEKTLTGLATGTVDIVIGTHKLLSESVRFARLGLVIIDEEHRFGVRQKERLKALRADVDILTLTATPIPRTLAMSLEGIRDFSVIATAPEKRLSVKTFIRRESDDLVREAILREIKRGGQVYFLHNEVETIGNRFDRLSGLVPEAKIVIAHGQMGERELEGVMREFLHQRYNVLLCTTIIENGIDNPNANTIIMHRADRFGLAQLHQLRGRVGRSQHQAYAYLLVPGEGALTKDAQKRLEAIQDLGELGSGFYLSMHDLEIRGAGEVLGEEQSGEMAAVGFDLYNQMLKHAVRELKAGREPEDDGAFSLFTEIQLHVPALLPEDYVGDVSLRLSIYKRLACAEDTEALETVIDELVDRFGKLPDAAKALIAAHRLRLSAQRIGIRKVDAANNAILFLFTERPAFDPMVLIRLAQTRRDIRLLPQNKIRLDVATTTLDSKLRAIGLIVDPLLRTLDTQNTKT